MPTPNEGGIIDLELDVDDSAGNFTGYDANTRDVDAATETAGGQLNTLLSQDSPYIQRAQAGSAQTANQRGLLNSSIAAGAGEAAAIDAALPIAQFDASVYGNVAGRNMDAINAALGHTSGAQNVAAGTILQGDIASTLQEEGATQDLAKITAQGDIDIQLQGLKNTSAEKLATIEANYKTVMQTSASASQVLTQVQKNISDIMADPDTSAAQKQAAVDHQTDLLQITLEVIGAIGNVDLAGLLDFSAFPDITEEEKEESQDLYDTATNSGDQGGGGGDGMGEAGPSDSGGDDSSTGP